MPEERAPSRDALDVGDVDAARAQQRELLLAEVLADGAHDADLVEEGRCEREVHGRAAEHPLAFPEGRLDGVIGDRSDDCDGHGRAP